MAVTTPNPSTIHLPRILCLHGGGTNATIFKIQMRTFLNHATLSSRFRFVFVDAPFYCAAGSCVLPVYADYGPFRRWSRWLPEHEEVEDGAAREEIVKAYRRAMERDDELGADGEWVGLLGFSQGAKMVGSLLYEMQIEREGGKGEKEKEKVNGSESGSEKKVQWRFGVVLAGRAPFVALSDETEQFAWCQKAGQLPGKVDVDAIRERPEMKLKIPTVHVHGLKDEG